MNKKSEYKKFETLLDDIVRVPHSKIKEKLDAEKAAKRQSARPKRKKQNP